MSVTLSAQKKFEIIESFISNENKTKTGEIHCVSARTVGRIVKEYKLVMNHTPYNKIYTEMNILVMPDDKVGDYAFNVTDLETLDDICDALRLYSNTDFAHISHFIFLGDTFKDVFDRAKGSLVDAIPEDDEYQEVVFAFSSEIDELENVIDEEFVDAMKKAIIEELSNPDASDEGSSLIDNFDWNLIATAKSITVTRTNKTSSETNSVEIAKGSENFRSAWTIIRETDMSDEDEVAISADEIFTMADPKSAIEKFSQGKLTVNVKEECVYYDGNPIHNSLTNRVIRMVTMNGIEGTQSLINFLEKLMENPSYRAVNSLYDFMQHNDIEINGEGNFYAWKRVRDNYTDCRTGTFDNSVGAEPSMARNMVNEDPEQTCSHGLHVAAKHYLNCFYGPITLMCEVDPRDVVSCPIDYNFAKLRTCRYKVVEDVSNQFSY
jgi:hypothetical protein